jgi:hypothetical protein
VKRDEADGARDTPWYVDSDGAAHGRGAIQETRR